MSSSPGKKENEAPRPAPNLKHKKGRTFIIPQYALEHFEAKYGRKVDSGILKKPAAVSQDEQLEELFDEIAAEIEERIAYLKEIESIGKSPEIEQRIKNEVAERIGELQKIREM